jgi:superoxide dismutase, Cu-Zn family
MRTTVPGLAMILSLALAGCATQPTPVATAVANLEPRSGSNARGTVTFTENSDGTVNVAVSVSGVTPPGVHGFHVHETGDCSAADATSAGGHFDVGGNPHGGPNRPPHHTGDFGNLTADANGVISTRFTSRTIRVSPGPNSVVGKAVILHASRDDLTSQPAGDSGARIACGVANLQTGAQ